MYPLPQIGEAALERAWLCCQELVAYRGKSLFTGCDLGHDCRGIPGGRKPAALQMVAEQALDIQALKGVLARKF